MDRSLHSYIKPVVERLLGKDHPGHSTPRKPEMLKSSSKLRLVRDVGTVYWENQFLTIKGRQFDILYKLAQRPEEVVTHQALYSLIESKRHKELLLRQYITSIRKAFPAPYSDPHHPRGIIKTRKMKGYYLNLSPDQVEIV